MKISICNLIQKEKLRFKKNFNLECAENQYNKTFKKYS